jgi:hypothetical protein
VAPGGKKLSRGNTFVIAELLFLRRPVALPVAARLWRRGGPAKTQLARELIGLIAAAPACRRRTAHVVADSAYICTELRGLAAAVTLTGPLPRHASLYDVHPELDNPLLRRGQRGRPRARGARIGTPADLAAATAGRAATVTRYGKTAQVNIHERRCLWPGVFRPVPVRVIVVTEPRRPGLALLSTDMATPPSSSSPATPPGGPSRSRSATRRTSPAPARPTTACPAPWSAPSRSRCSPSPS